MDVIIKYLTAIFILIAPLFASAVGFDWNDNNGAGIGNFQAGGAAIAEDASTVFSNPAGLVRLKDIEADIFAVGINPRYEFQGNSCGGQNCTPLLTHKDGGQNHVAGGGYFAFPINRITTIGIGINEPFWYDTDYGTSTPLRYNIYHFDLRTLDINPSIGVKFSEMFSAGVGISIQNASSELKQALNSNPARFNDTLWRNQGDDWALGYNIGLLYQFCNNRRVGINYRSQIVHDLEGSSRIQNGAFLPLTSNRFKLKITMPPSLTGSFYYGFSDNFSAMGSVTYTGWSNSRDIQLHNAVLPNLGNLATGIGDLTLDVDFKNTMRYALGLDYSINEWWRLRAGSGYETTPTSTRTRETWFPETGRAALAIGVGFAPFTNFSIDLGYTHFMIQNASINTMRQFFQTIGKSDNHADMIGLQLNWRNPTQHKPHEPMRGQISEF